MSIPSQRMFSPYPIVDYNQLVQPPGYVPGFIRGDRGIDFDIFQVDCDELVLAEKKFRQHQSIPIKSDDYSVSLAWKQESSKISAISIGIPNKKSLQFTSQFSSIRQESPRDFDSVLYSQLDQLETNKNHSQQSRRQKSQSQSYNKSQEFWYKERSNEEKQEQTSFALVQSEKIRCSPSTKLWSSISTRKVSNESITEERDQNYRDLKTRSRINNRSYSKDKPGFALQRVIQ